MRFLFLALLLLAGCKRTPEPGPPVPDTYGTLPEFRFVDQSGRPWGSKDLAGAPWIGNTFFTSCRTICPGLTKAAAEMQRRLADTPVRFASITIDPDNDIPDVLARYARDNGVDGERWRLLTGEYAAIRRLVVDGVKTALGQPPKDRPADTDIEHSGKLFLVDGEGRLRGWFSTDPPGLKALEAAARAVLR